MKKIPALTIRERKEILQQYELTAVDIRLLECKGINAARKIIKEIQKEFPQYEYNGLNIYSACYIEWKNKKAPGATDAQRKI